jgi:hypothetical protein
MQANASKDGEIMSSIENVTGKAKGGITRANNLSKSKRSEIASKAATARWALKIIPSG